jgi:hypothetical protein
VQLSNDLGFFFKHSLVVGLLLLHQSRRPIRVLEEFLQLREPVPKLSIFRPKDIQILWSSYAKIGGIFGERRLLVFFSNTGEWSEAVGPKGRLAIEVPLEVRERRITKDRKI